MADLLIADRPVSSVRAVVGRLSVLDRLLPVWVLLAMALGIAMGAVASGLPRALGALQVGTTSLPIAVGLLLMMYPVLARVRYEELGKLRRAWRLFALSLLLNWFVGPLLMFALAWLFLPDLPQYRTGLILVGLARCIAMVLVWNQLAGGDREVAAVLVALNSVFQVLAYAFYAYLFLTILPVWFGLGAGQQVRLAFGDVAQSVAIFLVVPLLAGAITRYVGVRWRGRTWYDDVAMPCLAPVALLALLFTIIVMFALQGNVILARPLDVVRIALPLVCYFALMFFGAFWLALRAGLAYAETASVAFTAAGNNFELAIAVAVGAFGITSGEALAAVVGPLIEVPALVALVYVALWLARRRTTSLQIAPAGGQTS